MRSIIATLGFIRLVGVAFLVDFIVGDGGDDDDGFTFELLLTNVAAALLLLILVVIMLGLSLGSNTG